MAGKIKGITIEIGGDTQKLNKALEDVNKKTRDVQSELRQVERLLKLDPGNTELVAQKQKLLAEAVENSREKLNRLKTAQEQVNEQFRKGEINEEQYRAFQREVVKAEQELKGFERQLNETAKASETFEDKLNKALEDVNKKSKDLQSELEQVERLLKLDPKNTELLAQKQKLLAEAVENSREKLNRLKTAQEQVNEQFRKGEINEEQYRAFQREVVKAEQELAKFEKQLRETGLTAEQVGQKLKDAGQKMTDVGKNLTMKVTAPVLAIGAAATKLGMDFEAAMSEVGAISGATGADLAKLEALAKEMGATTKFSASEAAEGLKYMAMAGWDTQQMLAGLPGVLSLAAASGEDLGLVSDIVTDAMTAFGMEAARAAEFADILAAASSNANTNVGMLGESFKYVAPVAGALGYEAKDVAIGLGLMANAGIKASQAGTAMRSMLTRLVKPTKESGMAMDQLGISLTDSEGRMKSFAQIMDDLRGAFQKLDPDQQAFYAAQIAGQEAMSGLLAIVNASEADYTKLSDAINNSTGAAQRMAKEMQDNLKGRLTELKSAIEGVALQLYDHLQPALEKIVEVVQKLVAWFANLSPGVQQTIIIIAGLAAAIGPLLVVFGAMASGLSAIIGILPVLGAALTALTGPIGIAIAAIAGLVAAGVLVYKNWDKIKEWLSNIWTAIKDTAVTVWDAIKNFFVEWGETILLLAVGPVGWAVLLGRKLAENWDAIKAKAREAWTAIVNAVTSIFSSAIEKVTNIGINIVEGIWNGIKSLGPWLKEKVESFIKENIPDAVAKLLKIKSPSQVMAEFGRYVAEGLARGMEEGTSEVAKKAQQMAQAISNAVQKMTGELSNALNLSNARLELQKELLGDNAEEYEKLALELEKLNNEKENLIGRIDVLTAAYETAKKELGENNEATKQYAYELEMAQIELQKMEVSIRKTSVAIEEQKKKAIEAARRQAQELRNLADEVTNVEKKYREDLAAAAEEYQKKVQEVNNKLIEDERRVTEEYEKAVEARAKSLRDFVGLFDAVTKKEISGQQLLENLRDQVVAFEDWQKNIQELAAKGVDEGLIAELREMGPKAGPEIAALNTLTDEELTEYVSLWRTKNQEAREEAVNQLRQQREEMQQKLMEIRQAANEQLELYRAEWEKKNAEIRKNAEEELKRIQDKFNETAEAGTKQGMKLILNFAQGMESQFDRLRQAVEEARAIAAELDPTMRHSPSLVDKVRSGLAEILAAYQDLARKIQNINLGSVSMPALAGAGGSVVYTYNNDNRVINITVQDGEDLLRTLHRLGVRIP